MQMNSHSNDTRGAGDRPARYALDSRRRNLTLANPLWWTLAALCFGVLAMLTGCQPETIERLKEVVVERTITDTVVIEEAVVVWRDTVICPPGLTRPDTIYRTKTELLPAKTVVVTRVVTDTLEVPVEVVRRVNVAPQQADKRGATLRDVFILIAVGMVLVTIAGLWRRSG
jgi:hypothetical protein